jgi:hypothetical protein
MPLGSAALAGTTYPIERARTAELLGFERLPLNYHTHGLFYLALTLAHRDFSFVA